MERPPSVLQNWEPLTFENVSTVATRLGTLLEHKNLTWVHYNALGSIDVEVERQLDKVEAKFTGERGHLLVCCSGGVINCSFDRVQTCNPRVAVWLTTKFAVLRRYADDVRRPIFHAAIFTPSAVGALALDLS